jgi:hypothetical protein
MSIAAPPWLDAAYAPGMAPLTQDEIAAKIATAENSLAQATSQYDRNMFTQIRDEYRRYADQRAKEIEKLAAAAS